MTNEGNTVYNSRLKNIASQYIDIIYESVKLQPFFWKKISKKYKFEDVKFDCIFDTQKAVMRTIALKRIKHNLIVKQLKIIIDNDNFEYDEEALGLIAQKSEGSLRDALSLLDQIIAYSDNKILLNDAKDILGVIDERIYLDLLINISTKKPSKTLEVLKESIESGISIHDFMSGYINFLRLCLHVLYNYERGDNFLSENCINKVKENMSLLNNNDIIQMINDCIDTQMKIKNFQQPYVAFEALFLRMSTNNNSIQNKEVLSSNQNQKSSNQDYKHVEKLSDDDLGNKIDKEELSDNKKDNLLSIDLINSDYLKTQR